MKKLFVLIATVGFMSPGFARAEQMSVDLPTDAPAATSQVSEVIVDAELDSTPTFLPSKLLFKVGPGWSSLSSYTAESDNRRKRTSVFISAEAEFPLTYDFSFQTGLNFIQKGSDYYSDGYLAQTLMNFIEIPMLARFNFRLTDRHSFSFSVGPYVAVALSSESTEQQGFESPSSEPFATASYSRFDFGGRIGADYEMFIRSNLSFLVGANYDLGFSDVVATSDSSSTRALMAGIGIAVKL